MAAWQLRIRAISDAFALITTIPLAPPAEQAVWPDSLDNLATPVAVAAAAEAVPKIAPKSMPGDSRASATHEHLVHFGQNMLLQLQNAILEMIARGDSLVATTERLCLEVEVLVPGTTCSILTVDAAGRLHPLASPSLPDDYSSGLDGLISGPSAGSCGTAAYRRAPVTVTDIDTDPLWAEYKAPALALGLAACWSSPICSGDGRVLGTFAFYYREHRGPSELEQTIVATCVHLCTIALERHERLREHQRLAYSDALSGLPNRAGFNLAISKFSHEDSGSWGLLLIDIDNLKIVNDTFGHEAGDGLIKRVAARIGSVASPERAFRSGGDEFAVIVRSQNGELDIAGTAFEILTALKLPAECGDHVIIPRATIGGAVPGPNDRSAEVVQQNADFALYHAKETNRGGFVEYTPRLVTTMTRRFRAVRDVGAALADNRIEAYYQPIVRLDTREIVSIEALCRMRSETGDVISAGEFYEATYDVHVASELTQRMLTLVAADVRRWLDLGIPFQHVGINISSADFHGGRLAERIAKAFQRVDVPLKHLILEVTESVYLGQQDHVIAREIQSLRSKGLRVALDDFGTGYASLTHLLSVPIDNIKIDKSFVDRLQHGGGSAAIIEGLIGIAEKLGIGVVAEGIETEEQARQLHALGCDLGQGYLFARAVAPHSMTDMLLRNAHPPTPARSTPARKPEEVSRVRASNATLAPAEADWLETAPYRS